MNPVLIAAMATFGVQKLRGKSTSRALRDAVMAAGFTYGIGEIGTGIEALGSGGVGSAGTITSSAGAAIPTADVAAGGIGSFGTTAGSFDPVFGRSVLEAGSTFTPSAASLQSGNLIAQGTKDFLGSTGEFGEGIKGVYDQGMAKFKGLDKASQFAIKYGSVPLATALLTPEELPPGMSYEEFMKLDKSQRDALLAEARKDVKGLGEKAQPLRTQSEPYNYQRGNPLYTPFNQGGIVSALPRYAQGGVNYLPSKVTHDENDVYNYTRATGYVEDGSGNGDKDEDTILAQLADGEFVSRADAILGAGIMAGASPSNFKDMRSKGASFFYEQQARFKRIFDLLDASRKVTTN